MIYVPEDFVSSEDFSSAEGQGFTLNITFCRDCVKHHTNECPMYYAEGGLYGEVCVITDTPDSGFCHVGEPKDE